MSGTELVAVHNELRALARGRGLRGPNLDARLGPLLRRRAALEGLSGALFRARLGTWLSDRVAALPGDLRLVAGVALGLDPNADHRLLMDRLGWLSVEFDRDPRTIRRRSYEAFRLLSETIVAGREIAGGDGGRVAVATQVPARGAAGWYVESVWALMRLDGPSPELIECRRIVAVEDGLTEVVLSMSLPRPPDAPSSPRDLGVDVVFGGRIVRVDRRGESHFSPVLRLPHPLDTDERHEFGFSWRVPPGQPIVPHYAMSPTIRCDELELRVRFPDGAEPTVQRLDGLPLRAVEDPAIDLPVVPLDGAGEVAASFGHLALGLCYGLRWT